MLYGVNRSVFLSLQLFGILVMVLFCRRVSSEYRSCVFPLDSLELRDGDLVFRMGRQEVSRIVTTLDGGDFSHVGILIHTDLGWCVIHAVPGETTSGPDRVQCDPVSVFFSSDRASRGALLRVACSAQKSQQAAQLAFQKYTEKTEFDHDYDLNDTVRFYCTELVWFVYSRVGMELAEGRRHQLVLPGRPEWYIFPDDLWKSPALQVIWCSE